MFGSLAIVQMFGLYIIAMAIIFGIGGVFAQYLYKKIYKELKDDYPQKDIESNKF